MSEKGLGGLIRETVGDVTRLLKLEAAVAGRKIKGSAQMAGVGAGAGGAAVILGLMGLLLLLVSTALALWIVLPIWAAFLIVGGGAVVVAGILAMAARMSLRKASERASGATDQLKEDLRWVRDRTR